MTHRRLIALTASLRCRLGSAAVEFALVMPMALMILIGVVEVGRALWIRSSLQFAAEEAVRYAMVHQSASDAELTDFTLDRLPGVDPDAVQAAATRETINGTDFVTLNATYQFNYLSALIPGEPFVLTGRSRVPLLD
jgi:Flp pilus assembly protein TadG